MQRHTKVLVIVVVVVFLPNMLVITIAIFPIKIVVVVVVVVFLPNMLVITIAIFPIKIYTNQKSVKILVNKQ